MYNKMMKARTQHRTEAIVLRLLDYGESDRIVTFYTAGFGKLRGIAKGARRSRKRFANALEPFSCSQILFSSRGPDSLALIEGSDVIAHFPAIRADLEKTLSASYLIDLTDRFTLEDKKNEALFSLLHGFLKIIETGPVTEAILRFFEIRLLKLSGYDPLLDHCLICKAPLEKEQTYRFKAADGGLTCMACRPDSQGAIPVSLGTIRTLLLGREMEIDRLGRLLLSDRSADESRQLLAHFIRHILGRELKSVHVLNEIRSMGEFSR
ncbi:MAG TPA: DNA repair protein RecO [Syntrophus sp. (in: bacteria)]|nr:MAG: DNA repair protein RecO [Syntrophus sp. GWC2_56_31]HBB15639.1 DNA repair protein RecO [Syntrophus sp. (in: bacteria)]